MTPMQRGLQRGMTLILILIIPFIILIGAVRGLMTPLFLNVEYHLPGFPADTYGFTTQDRLHWAGLTYDYAWSNQDISFLGNLRFQDGTPIYNERELSHMHDVQALGKLMLRLWAVALVLLVVLAVLAWRLKWWRAFRMGISYGGWLMVGIVVTVLVFVATSFNSLFTDFHHLFFQGDTWLFYYSDTLIRLFPIRFWTDVFIVIGVTCLVIGGLLGVLGRPRSGERA